MLDFRIFFEYLINDAYLNYLKNLLDFLLDESFHLIRHMKHLT